LIIVLVLVAIALGLWLGHRAGRSLPRAGGPDGDRKTLGARVREAATNGVVRLWKWNRERKKPKKAPS
jgi:hypothetical protein